MKKDLGKFTGIVPMPVLIIGTYDEDGNPDAMNAAWGGVYDYNQVCVSLGNHVSTSNIRKNRAFSISFATKDTVKISDYVGLVSLAKDKDKIKKAGLHVVESNHVNAPLFEEYPLTIECKLISIDGEEGEGGFVVGEIVNLVADEKILTNGKVDFDKLQPIVFDGINAKYRVVGEEIADAFKVGLSLK